MNYTIPILIRIIRVLYLLKSLVFEPKSKLTKMDRKNNFIKLERSGYLH